jgi:hypothetical protein
VSDAEGRHVSDAEVEMILAESRHTLVQRQQWLEDQRRNLISCPPQTMNVAEYSDHLQFIEDELLLRTRLVESLDENWGVPTVLREIYEHLFEEPGVIAHLRDAAKARDHNATESNGAHPFDRVSSPGLPLPVLNLTA